jgi:hypothetical protein
MRTVEAGGSAVRPTPRAISLVEDRRKELAQIGMTYGADLQGRRNVGMQVCAESPGLFLCRMRQEAHAANSIEIAHGFAPV